MKNVAIISVFVMAIGAAAANDCETLINQFEETGNACYESCYAAGRVREGIVQIAEVSRRNMQLRNKRPRRDIMELTKATISGVRLPRPLHNDRHEPYL